MKALVGARRGAVAIAAVAACLLLPLQARAGRTAHLFSEESQIVPEGDVELEQWVWAETRIPDVPNRPTFDYLWWGPVAGVTPHLELALPLQILATPGRMALQSVGLDARYRIFSRQDDEGLQPLIRLSYVQTTNPYDPPRVELALVASYGGPSQLRATLNLVGRLQVPALGGEEGGATFTGLASGGLSVPISREVRLAAELLAQQRFAAPAVAAQLYAGPSLEWTHGPWWVTLGSLVGLTGGSSRFLPKVLWAVTL